MDTILLKLVATPVLILAASLAGRRWGEAVSGWFVGLPLTSGPVCFFIAVEQGPLFAAETAHGSLGGAGAEAAFCLAYAIMTRWVKWPAALATGSIAYIACAALFTLNELPTFPLLVVVVAALVAALLLMPTPPADATTLPHPPHWDLPARMITAGALVFGLTEAAPHLGPQLSGLISTYPVFAAVLTAFAHHRTGAGAATRVLCGLLMGLFSFAAFFVVLGAALVPFGIGSAFAAAIIGALAVQGASLWLLGRASRHQTITYRRQ